MRLSLGWFSMFCLFPFFLFLSFPFSFLYSFFSLFYFFPFSVPLFFFFFLALCLKIAVYCDGILNSFPPSLNKNLLVTWTLGLPQQINKKQTLRISRIMLPISICIINAYIEFFSIFFSCHALELLFISLLYRYSGGIPGEWKAAWHAVIYRSVYLGPNRRTRVFRTGKYRDRSRK